MRHCGVLALLVSVELSTAQPVGRSATVSSCGFRSGAAADADADADLRDVDTGDDGPRFPPDDEHAVTTIALANSDPTAAT